MAFDETFLQRTLCLPESAIAYTIGMELARSVAPRFVLELPGSEIDVWAFERAGHCTTTLREGIHSQTGSTWARRGKLEEHQGTSWVRVQWQGQHLEAVMACWQSGFHRQVSHWIIADDEATARAFAAELADFAALPTGAFMVFANGCWSSDTAAFEAVRAARQEDLILKDGFLERILQDARSFVAGRATYMKYGLAYKRGLLFAGAPGNGKTACLRILLRELALPTLIVRSFSSRYGDVESNVAAAFMKAKRAAPCALVLEDLDVLVRGGALSALLNELDGLGADTGILTLATSNHPEALDPALAERPSRFDRVYRFDAPDREARHRYLAHWNRRLEAELRVGEATVVRLADDTAELSFASLQELVVSATVRWVAEAGQRAMADLLTGELAALLAQRQSGARTAEVPTKPPVAFKDLLARFDQGHGGG